MPWYVGLDLDPTGNTSVHNVMQLIDWHTIWIPVAVHSCRLERNTTDKGSIDQLWVKGQSANRAYLVYHKLKEMQNGCSKWRGKSTPGPSSYIIAYVYVGLYGGPERESCIST